MKWEKVAVNDSYMASSLDGTRVYTVKPIRLSPDDTIRAEMADFKSKGILWRALENGINIGPLLHDTAEKARADADKYDVKRNQQG